MYTPSSRNLPDSVHQTYFLLALSIISYLFGAYIPVGPGLSFSAVLVSFIFFFLTASSHHPIFLIGFAFSTGISHSVIFDHLNMIDPTIVQEALVATFMVFVGLSFIAFQTLDYSTFAMYGFLYSSLSSLIWMSILNIFFQNDMIELVGIYFTIVIFTGFVIVDTHSLIKNPDQSPVDHAIQLFLDFLNIFLNLVKLMKQMKKKNRSN